MTFIGRLHPLLLHFPIALVIAAAFAEFIAIRTNQRLWHLVAVANIRLAAVFAVATAVTGWILASTSVVDDVRSLQWHRWVGTAAAVGTIAAALAGRIDQQWSTQRWVYRIGVFGAAALVAVTGHLGASLVWGADFLRP
jgi:uncharacterized membrane protein